MSGPTDAGTALLEARGLTMRFGGMTALEGIDFRLTKGELRCLIGPNGAGKSTFFKCLTGQYRPSAGTVRLAGEDLRGLSGHEIARRGVGIKMQVPSVFERLAVRENVWLAACRVARGAAADRLTEATMERLGIASLAAVPLDRLAHGQRQRVELAMVLVSDPPLILLDEPAAGMSGRDVDDLVALVKALNEHHTLVVVEHDMNFIRRIATGVTVLHRGRVLREGQVAEILADPVVRDVYLGREPER